MTTYYAKAAGSILAADAWNTAANGSGTDTTFADGNAAGHTLDLNALAMTSPNGTTLTCTLLQSGATNAGGTLTITGTLTIAGKVKYTHTSTSGMVIVGTSANLTVNPATGAGTTAVENTTTGYAVVASSDGVVTISNSGGTAVKNSSSGRGLYHNSTGNLAITGSIESPGTGRVSVNIVAVCTAQLDSDIGNCGNSLFATLTVGGVAATVTVNGKLGGAASTGFTVENVGGTVNWTGSRTLAVNEEAFINQMGGTLNLSLAGSKLTHANSGTLIVRRASGTLNTADAGAGAASIENQVAASYAAILGGTTAQKGIITGPVIPAEADVLDSADDYGYAGDLQTGTAAAGGGGVIIVGDD